MEEDVSKLLTSWGMDGEIVQKFKEENVDTEAMQNLLLDDLRFLIPSVGYRTKFRVCWLAWKEKLHALEDETSSATTATPASSSTSWTSPSTATKKHSNEHSAESEQTTRSTETESNAEETHCTRSNPLKLLLNGNVRLKSLLTCTNLTKADRCSLARCIVSHLIQTTPGSILKPPQIDQWAQYVVELFPQEEKTFYYFSVGNHSSSNESSGSRQLPSKSRRYYGCLWDNWNNERKKLRSKSVIPFKSKKSLQNGRSSSVSSEITALDADQVNESERCLKIVEDFQGDEITEYLRDAWKKSRQQRRNILAKQEFTEEYLRKFPVLKNQEIASHLIDIDFRECSPVNSDIALAEELQKHEQVIICKARERYSKLRDKIQRTVVDNIFKCTESGGETAAALLLLPFLFSSGGKVNAKGQKASRAEAASKFILLCKSLADAEEIILQQRKQSKKKSIQPLVIALGSNWSTVTSAYVYVDQPLYRFNNILDAVQMCFKVFFAFDLKYPLECEHVWLFIQRGFFKICLSNDKTILGVNQVLHELNISTV